jgi:hypothetical protein
LPPFGGARLRDVADLTEAAGPRSGGDHRRRDSSSGRARAILLLAHNPRGGDISDLLVVRFLGERDQSSDMR